MRLVLDTNCVVSAFLWGGTPLRLFGAVVEGQCQLFTSGALLTELEDVLAREKFKSRFLSAHTSVAQLLADYTGQVTVVHTTSISPTIIRQRSASAQRIPNHSHRYADRGTATN